MYGWVFLLLKINSQRTSRFKNLSRGSQNRGPKYLKEQSQAEAAFKSFPQRAEILSHILLKVAGQTPSVATHDFFVALFVLQFFDPANETSNTIRFLRPMMSTRSESKHRLHRI